MNNTEHYLKAATRGLWGRERRALKVELRGHVSARVQEFRLGGLSEAEAERQTLRELGAPVQVSGGMLGVHTLPALGKAGALTALLMTGLLTVLPQGLAQVSGKFFRPAGQESLYGANSYLDLAQLKIELKSLGGDLTGPVGNMILTLPDHTSPKAALDTSTWAGASTVQNGHQYIQSDALVLGLLNTGADLRLSGWNPVQIHAGRAVLSIVTGGDSRVSNSFYRNLLGSFAEQSGTPILTVNKDEGQSDALTFNGPLKDGHVYALVVPVLQSWTAQETPTLPKGGEVVLSIDTNIAKNGKVILRKYGATDHYNIQTSIIAFQKALDPYRSAGKASGWDAKHPAPALLLELSGHFGKDAYTVVNPATVKGTITDH